MRTLSDKQYEMMGLEASAIYDKHAALIATAAALAENGMPFDVDVTQIKADLDSIADKKCAGLVAAALFALPVKLTTDDKVQSVLMKATHAGIVYHLVTGLFGVPLGKPGVGAHPSSEGQDVLKKFNLAAKKD